MKSMRDFIETVLLEKSGKGRRGRGDYRDSSSGTGVGNGDLVELDVISHAVARYLGWTRAVNVNKYHMLWGHSKRGDAYPKMFVNDGIEFVFYAAVPEKKENDWYLVLACKTRGTSWHAREVDAQEKKDAEIGVTYYRLRILSGYRENEMANVFKKYIEEYKRNNGGTSVTTNGGSGTINITDQ